MFAVRQTPEQINQVAVVQFTPMQSEAEVNRYLTSMLAKLSAAVKKQLWKRIA